MSRVVQGCISSMVSQLLHGVSKTLKASDHVVGKMATRGGKNITEVLVASAKFSEDPQEYMAYYWDIMTITISCITLSFLQKKEKEEANGNVSTQTVRFIRKSLTREAPEIF